MISQQDIDGVTQGLGGENILFQQNKTLTFPDADAPWSRDSLWEKKVKMEKSILHTSSTTYKHMLDQKGLTYMYATDVILLSIIVLEVNWLAKHRNVFLILKWVLLV